MKNNRVGKVYTGIFISLIIVCIMSLTIGTVKISLSDLWDIISGKIVAGGENDVYRNILFEVRLPRMVAALLAGGALALSGYLLQTFFHNAVAGPYLLGISSGAKMAVALALVFFYGSAKNNSLFMVLASFLGAMAAMVFVIICSRYIGRMSVLLVCGVMIGYICNAICDIIVTFASDADIVNLHNWSRGSLAGITMEQVYIMLCFSIPASILTMAVSKQISAFQISENFASSVGVNISLFKVLIVVLSGVLSACVTAFAGPVSFVGIAVPHVIKSLLKTGNPKIVIPACFVAGAAFTCFCDLLSKIIFAPTELSISTVTAVFGAPVVISLLIRKIKY